MADIPKSGGLVKMLIESFDDPKFKNKRPNGSFTASFNPSKYNLKYEIEYDKKAASGSSPNAPKFSNMKQQELSLEFFLDDTGVEDNHGSVDKNVDAFLKVCYNYDGSKHKNNYLRISWSYLVFDCVLQDADISFVLFRSDGLPLRARINAKFLGFVNDELRVRKDKQASPDVTHLRVVGDKQKLPLLAYQIYQVSQYYLDVAARNNLIHFRKLSTGKEIYFPPLTNTPDVNGSR